MFKYRKLSQMISLLFIFILSSSSLFISAQTTKSEEREYNWGTLNIGGGGFVSGLVAGKKEMYLRTDVGGAYKYDYANKKWVQLFSYVDETKVGFLSVRGIAIDPTNDNIVYFLCGYPYFSDGKTVIIKTTDGGKKFTEIDVTKLIQVNGNGDGRVCSEQIAVNPDNPKIIYAGGNVASGSSALIKSIDGGLTWEPVSGYDSLGFFKYEIKWPLWTDHVVRGTVNDDYVKQSGINAIKIYEGKIYVATAINGQANIHVADINEDSFSVLSTSLPTKDYPLTITDDSNGNLFITYIKGLNFDGESGGAYKYNINSKKVTDISPVDSSIGIVYADKTNPDRLETRTTGRWNPQYYSVSDSTDPVTWGDYFFTSIDGGESWTNITPGQLISGDEYLSLPMSDNGYKWILGKSIHWGAGIVIDPRNSNKMYMLSGNGVFACDNIWDSKNIQFYFDPKGIEETVPLDMVSVKDGYVYDVVKDYDGFIHKSLDSVGTQYIPNIGSTAVFAYCFADKNIMMRISEYNDEAYYSKDAGKSWTRMNSAGGNVGGNGAITKYNGKYIFFHSFDKEIKYSDNFGENWYSSSGVIGDHIGLFVEESDPKYVYYYSRGEYNGQTYFGVSKDGGKSFTYKTVCKNDGSNFSNRIAYLEKGTVVVSAGYNGAYIVSYFGTTLTKINVNFCKTIGFGTPKKKGKPNVLYMFGKILPRDPEGIYRSENKGRKWVLINSKNLFGGTGNGNFLVGDVNTFGIVYMSTVGNGVVYGKEK